MEKLKTYVELPYKGKENYESDFVSAFGYVDIHAAEINQYLIAREYCDNCNEECSCDPDYYNPAFLMHSNEFSEYINPNNPILSDSFKLFSNLDAVNAELPHITKHNIHKGNDLLIYQLTREQNTSPYVTLAVIKIIPSIV